MGRRRTTAEPTAPPSARPGPALEELGLARGDQVRFRRGPGRHWHHGIVSCRETDGSVGLHDDKAAARAIAVDRLEVRVRGPHGGTRWEPLAARATIPGPEPHPEPEREPEPAPGPSQLVLSLDFVGDRSS